MPRNAKILTAAWHKDCVSVWVEVSVDEALDEERKFLLAYTGMHEIPDKCKYISTVIMPCGTALHVYEVES